MILKASEVRAGDAIVWTDGTVRVVNKSEWLDEITYLRVRDAAGHDGHYFLSDAPIICVARNYPLGEGT